MAVTVAQSIALGALVQGIEVVDRADVGGWWDWLTPFSVLTAVALVIGYTLQGVTGLNMKTDGYLRQRAHGIVRTMGAKSLRVPPLL